MDNSNSAAMNNQNDYLPIEILLTIFMTLNLADLAAASLVCKTWNQACRDPSLWRKLDLSRLSSYFFNKPNNKPGSTNRSSTKMTQFLKHVLSLSNGNITCLVFNYNDYLTDEQFIIAAERTPNLKRLVLPNDGDFSRAVVKMAMKSWGGLESITISSAVPSHYIFPAIREYCKNITEMKFSYGCLFEEKHAEAMIKCTPNLKVLSIRTIMVSTQALITLVTFLEHLEAVNICHSFIIGPHGMDISDLRNHLPQSSMEKLIYCQGGWCLRCKNRRDDTLARIFQCNIIHACDLEDIWREDEIISLAH